MAPCHAEVQLLLQFECFIPANAEIFPYFGCSKKSCWLCHQLLSTYKPMKYGKTSFYQTRGCHGQVYPLWRISLPVDPPPNPRVRFYLSTSLQDIEVLMIQKLQAIPIIQRPKMAELSANVTVAGGRLRRQALAKQRIIESSERLTSSGTARDTLTDFVCSRDCLRIPATGESPHLLSINFYKCSSNYNGREPRNFHIPHFGAFWGLSNLERGYYQSTLGDQNPAELNGDYLMYWCLNDHLPPNKNVMSLLGIDSVEIDEHFWYGDVVITRFHEDDISFKFHCEDVPESYLGLKRDLRRLVKVMWEGKVMDNETRAWREFETHVEKVEADKEILLGRI
ncbi:hypothetical protein V8C42DRAFT_358803 [Trichoderma barbatum]